MNPCLSLRAAATVLALLLSLSMQVAVAQSAVENRSTVAADGKRTLELSVLVPAAAPDVWAAWATSEGWRSWATPFAIVDFRLGGSIEAAYAFDAKAGDPDNVRNQIVALVQGRMFAVRNVQAPRKVPFDAAAFQTLHTVVFVDSLGPASTRVTVVMPDVPPGPPFDGVYKHFEWGNDWTLNELRKRFVEGPKDWEKVKEAMRKAAERK
jgi:uncharacterized protein YndB with AHSA1/START domain